MEVAFEFRIVVQAYPGDAISDSERGLITDVVSGTVGGFGYMVDIAHKPIDCTAAVAAAVAAEREALLKDYNSLLKTAAEWEDDDYRWGYVAALKDAIESIRFRARGGGGNNEPVDRTALKLAAEAERQGRHKVAQWLRDYFWNSIEGERLRRRTKDRNSGSDGGGEEAKEGND